MSSFQGALVGSLTSLSFCLWIAIGKYVSGQSSSSLPPVSTDQCPLVLTNGHGNYSAMTEAVTETVVTDGADR